MKLVLATGNVGKAKEIRRRLAPVAVETLADHPDIEMPPEDAPDFAGNARIKAEHVCRRLEVPVLADDSGLCVDALNGAPGVHSARYAPTDPERIDKLLRALSGVTDRRARFVCAVALAVPGEATIVREGTCEGVIGIEPKGTGGFGYDPIFVLEDGRTMAELAPEDKNAISHRGRAIAAMMPTLSDLFARQR